MSKRIICTLLMLTLILSLLSITAPVSADTATATVRVGGQSYTVAVGDFVEYDISLSYPAKKLSSAQIELPVDFSGLSGYTQDELDQFTSRIAPTTKDSVVALRFDGDGAVVNSGYVMNFCSLNGIDFGTEQTALSLIFGVEKAGTYDLSAKVRFVEDIDGKTIVDSNYNCTDTAFKYTESLYDVDLEAPKVSVATGAGGMRISWEPVPRASLYRVYYKGSNGWTKLTDTTETAVLDTEVSSGNRYTYTVRCLSADGSRFISDYDHDGKSAVYYPAPILKLSNGEDCVNISWDPVDYASSYRVYYKNGGSWTKLTDTTGTSCRHEGVVSGTDYTYTIRSMDSSGKHLSWYYDGFTIKFIKAPDIKLSNAADGVKISWDKVDGAVKYRLFYYGSRGWTRLADTAETSFVDTDVTSSYNYTYTARCITEDGSEYTSDYRPGRSIRFYAAPILSLKNGEDNVRLSWNAITGASSYRVYYKGGNGWTKLTDTADTSCTDGNVVSGREYTYTIRAMDGNGNHLSWYYADGFTIKFVKAPEFSVSNVENGVKISWQPVDGASRYRVFYYGSKGWTRLVDTSETSFIDEDVYSNHNYTYTVRCINEDGSEYISDYRPGRSVKYYEAPVLNLSSTAQGVGISWDAVEGVGNYRVYRYGDNGWAKIADTTSTSIVDTNVVSGSKYTYTIRCMNDSGTHISWYYPDGFTITYLS